jgi:hypothetical protein
LGHRHRARVFNEFKEMTKHSLLSEKLTALSLPIRFLHVLLGVRLQPVSKTS